ncbi:MAG TPA: rRNA maturation RNase YbeY [Terriglobales bacterium]|nr:rRNA maturation RNase YbeY [Terriglobales bacterium]
MIIIEQKLGRVGRAGLEQFLRQARKLAGVEGPVDVLVASRRRIQALNRRFRRKNKPTDVLSFSREQGNGNAGGDIAICAEIARDNAHRYGHSVAQEIKVLLLHGMLHLAGYDHATDRGQMARKEAALRARLKLPASLIGRSRNLGSKP